MNKKTIAAILALVIVFTTLSAGVAIAEKPEISDFGSSMSEFEFPESTSLPPLSLEMSNVNTANPDASLLEVDLGQPNDLENTAFALYPSVPDELTTRSAPTTNSASRAGQYSIDENTAYTHSLSAWDDWNVYICQVAASGHATAFLHSTSAMDFRLIVQVYDSTFSTLKSEDESIISRSIYQGQRVRKSVVAGDIVVIGIEMNPDSSFVANSYQVGVVRNSVGGWTYEINEQPGQAPSLGATSPSGTILSSETDNAFDVDWYKFTHTDTTSYPVIAYAATSNNIKAALYQESGGVLYKVKDLTNNSTWSAYASNAENTYYVVVYSTNYTIGDYLLGVASEKIYLSNRIIVIDFSGITGDQGAKSYFSMGSRQTARYGIMGNVTLKDTKGNPIPNFQYAVIFASQMGSSGYTPIASDVRTTNSNGVGSAVLSIPAYASMFFYTDYIKPYDHHVNGARVIVNLPDGFTPQSSFNYKDFWHYGGQTWVG